MKNILDEGETIDEGTHHVISASLLAWNVLYERRLYTHPLNAGVGAAAALGESIHGDTDSSW